jgi:hypothetical protein
LWPRCCTGCVPRPAGCASCPPPARRVSYLPAQSGYNKRLRAALPLLRRAIRALACDLICTPAGLPVTWALANPKPDDRQVLTAIRDHDPLLLAERPGLLIVADKGYVSKELDRWLSDRGAQILRPTYRNHTPAPANTSSNQSGN